jgi:pyruvate-ferredoxin/flavodoxin oxidoreductase
VDQAIEYLKDQIKKLFGKKGDKIVKMNWDAVDGTLDNLIEIDVPASWARPPEKPLQREAVPEWVSDVMQPMMAQKGDNLPVSQIHPDGIFPVATTQYEKRGVAINVPEWIMDNCIQCNQCAMVCPHAAIRPFLLTDEEMAKAPAAFEPRKPSARSSRATSSACRCTPKTAWAAATARTSARPRKRPWS